MAQCPMKGHVTKSFSLLMSSPDLSDIVGKTGNAPCWNRWSSASLQRQECPRAQRELTPRSTFTGQKNKLPSFVLEKEFTERVGEEKKAPGSTQQCL